MKTLKCFSRILSLTIVLLARSVSYAQGTVNFNNWAFPNIDAPVTFLDGTPVGEGFIAQLYGGPTGTPLTPLTPQFPTTTFRVAPVRAGRVNPVTVTFSNVALGEQATVVMRVYNGGSWETSGCRGESNPIVITTSGGLRPEALLRGLQPFQVDCIPEPGLRLRPVSFTGRQQVQFDLLTNFPNKPTLVQSSVDLQVWTTIVTMTPGSNVFRFVDSEMATVSPQRFYRAVVPP